ncbi:MAG: hypothetical protein U0168_29100 [Nannocystaceae bacterium]
MLTRVVASALACGIATAAARVQAADIGRRDAAAGPNQTSPARDTASASDDEGGSTPLPAFASVTVAPSVRSADAVRAWAQDGVSAALANDVVDPSEVGPRALVVEVGGKTLDYVVTVGVRDATQAAWLAGPDTTRCACSPDALVEHVRGAVAQVIPSLRPQQAPSPAGDAANGAAPTGSSPRPHPGDTEPPRRARPRSNAMTAAGASTLAAGAVVTGLGVALALRRPRYAVADDASVEHARTTVPAGVTLAALGGVALVTGVVLLAVGVTKAKKANRAKAAQPVGHADEHRETKQSFAAPWLGPAHFGVSLQGRF